MFDSPAAALFLAAAAACCCSRLATLMPMPKRIWMSVAICPAEVRYRKGNDVSGEHTSNACDILMPSYRQLMQEIVPLLVICEEVCQERIGGLAACLEPDGVGAVHDKAPAGSAAHRELILGLASQRWVVLQRKLSRVLVTHEIVDQEQRELCLLKQNPLWGLLSLSEGQQRE